MKKLVALFLALAMLCSCCMALAEEDRPDGYPEIRKDENGNTVDLGGMEITVYDYWSGTGERAAEPTEQQQAQYNFQDWLMKTYNFTYKQVQGGDWSTNVQECINFTSAPDGSYRMYLLPPEDAPTLVANGAVAPWLGVDFTKQPDKWNKFTMDLMTMQGNVYGVATYAPEPRQCLFFNKRVLEEAGIEWESIYDMQAEGTWTWDVFEDMLNTLTKDTDNDGQKDLYGLTGSNMDLYMIAVFSNNASFMDLDENGHLQISVNDDTLTAMQWAKDIWANYAYQQPADGQWDYYKAAWKQGFCGFYMYQTYGGFNDNSEMADMEDEWGCVAFPKGPSGEKYVHISSDNTVVIPNVYTEEEIKKMTFAFDVWNDQTPGYDGEDSWIGNKYMFTDDRAVDETYAMLREYDHTVITETMRVGKNNDVLGQDFLWNLGSSTPAELVEAKTPSWEGLIKGYNEKVDQNFSIPSEPVTPAPTEEPAPEAEVTEAPAEDAAEEAPAEEATEVPTAE